MFNVGLIQNALSTGVVITYPLWLIEIVQNQNYPTAIAAQGWLIAVVGAAMGLVKIALWLRNYKEEKNGYNVNSLVTIRDLFQHAADEMIKITEKMAENQQKLSDNQNKAFENHVKILEAMSILRMQLQNTENNIISSQEKRILQAMAEAKDTIRDLYKGK